MRRGIVDTGQLVGCAVFDDASLRCWGNSFALGGPPNQIVVTPKVLSEYGTVLSVDVGVYSSICAIQTDRRVRCTGVSSHVKEGALVPEVADAVDVSAGDDYACAVDGLARVWCWGSNATGKTGAPPGTSFQAPAIVGGIGPARRVVSGSYQTCAVLLAGSVVCWGGFADRSKPLSGLGVVREFAGDGLDGCALDVNGAVRCFGPSVGNWTQALLDIPPAVEVSNGCAVTVNHELWCWGAFNRRSMISVNVWTRRYDPAPVPMPPTVSHGGQCTVGLDHRLRCWGSENRNGELGTGTQMVVSTPVLIDGFTGSERVVRLSGGEQVGCALLANATAKCWGTASLGDGTGDASHVPVPVAATGVTSIVPATEGGCLNVGVELRCWGQVGPQRNPSSMIPLPVAGAAQLSGLAANGRTMCGIAIGGTVQCWGDSLSTFPAETPGVSSARLLAGTGTSYGLAAVEGDADLTRFSPGLPKASMTQLGESVVELGASNLGTCLRVVGRAVDCAYLQGAVAPQVSIAAPSVLDAVSFAVAWKVRSILTAADFVQKEKVCVVRAGGTVVCAGVTDGAYSEVTVPGIDDAVEIAAIGLTFCVRTSTGRLKCWGDGTRIPQRGYGFLDLPWPAADLAS